jgi:hypothetical protein
MPADGNDAACTGAGVRKPSMKETAMGEGWWCGLHYGNYMSAALSSPISRPFSLSSILLFDLKSLFFRPAPDLCAARRAKSVKDGAIAPPSGLVLD